MANMIQSTFKCQFVGCTFMDKWHRNVLRHNKRAHWNETKFKCYKCPRTIDGIMEFENHIMNDHYMFSSKNQNRVTRKVVTGSLLKCKCRFVVCRNLEFESINELIKHLNNTHKKQHRKCIFEDCNVIIKPNVWAGQHFNRVHLDKGHKKLAKENLCHPPLEESDEDDVTAEDPAEYIMHDEMTDIHESTFGADGDSQTINMEQLEEECLKSFSMFLNDMNYVDNIPCLTVDKISSAFLRLFKLGARCREEQLLGLLTRNYPEMNANELKELLGSIKDPYLEAQEKLSSSTSRKKFVQENFPHVKQKEIVLNKEEVRRGLPKDVIHFVPVSESLKVMYGDPTFQEALRKGQMEEKPDGVLKDIKDGAIYKNNIYFKNNPESLALVLYSDGVETINPLSYAKGTQKLVCCYWSCVDVPIHLRSISNVQTCLVFKEKLLKKYQPSQIFHCLLEDLESLERDGVTVEKPCEKVIKAGLLAYVADNLEAHQIGGFSTCFSSKYICRKCLIQHPQLKTEIHDFSLPGGHKRLTREEYDSIVNAQADDETETVETYGISEEGCVFNKLEAFHCTESLPNDIMHDLLEGAIPIDLYEIIKKLSADGWFTLEEYNTALRQFKFSPEESKSKPQPVPTSGKSIRLKGKAVSNWIHLRNFNLILISNNWIRDINHRFLKLGILLHEVCERSFAETVHLYELDILDDVTREYLDLRKELFDEFNIESPKPKHHYLHHIKENIFNFGPVKATWTAPYECKHRDVKAIVGAAKNFINVSFTITERLQFRLTSSYYHGFYKREDFTLPKIVFNIFQMKKSGRYDRQFIPFLRPEDLLSRKITFKSRLYSTDKIILLRKVRPDQFDVGLMKLFIVRSGEVMTIIKRFEVFRHELNIFESFGDEKGFQLIRLSDLDDSYPLKIHGNENYFRSRLHSVFAKYPLN